MEPVIYDYAQWLNWVDPFDYAGESEPLDSEPVIVWTAAGPTYV